MTQTLASKGYARQLYATAMEFYQTYAVLEEVNSPRHDFIAMKHFLLCHALELALKGLLVDTGQYNEDELKAKFGHDLEKLANKVKQVYGSFPEVDACMGFISILNPDYKSKGYEYPINGGRFKGTSHEQFGAVVEVLIRTAARSIQSYTYSDVPLP